MHSKTAGLLLCSLIALLVGCKKPAEVQPAQPQVQTTLTSQTPGAPKFDACTLITNQEIETIEGSPLKETKPSGRSDSGLRFSQCFFTTAEFSRSVSLSVTQSDPDSKAKRSVKEFWEGTFGRYEKEEKEKAGNEEAGDNEKKESLRQQRRNEEEEATVPPKKIEGVGDEAYWIPSRVGGALYVLKKDAFVRVSVGGPDKEETKVEKCKALAQKAIDRL